MLPKAGRAAPRMWSLRVVSVVNNRVRMMDDDNKFPRGGLGLTWSPPMRMLDGLTITAALLLSTFLLRTDAWAQVAGNDATVIVLDAITVTARRHSEDEQDVPISMSVVEGEQLKDISPANANSDIVRLTPNVSLHDMGGPFTNFAFIRGIGSLQPLSPDDTSVTFNVNEVPSSAMGIPPSTMDLSRLEVLRGPQGTLYGRGSQAGAINYIANRPAFSRELSLRGEIGTNGWRLGELIANAPVIDDVLAGRLALQYAKRDGDVENVVMGGKDGAVDVGAARGSLLFQPTADSSALLTLSYNKNDDTHALNVLRDADCYPCSAVDPRNDFQRENYGASLRIEHAFDDFQLTSISNVQHDKAVMDMDILDGLIWGVFGYPPEMLNIPRDNLTWGRTSETGYFQELRLSSLAYSPVTWTGGVNVFRSEYEKHGGGENITWDSFGVYSGFQDNHANSNSYAVFGETTVPLVGALKGTLGLRLTHEDKDVHYSFVGDGLPGTVASHTQDSTFSDTFLTGRAGLSHDWSDSLMTYMNIGRGAVAGGYSATALNIMFGRDETLYPTSTSWSYEAGFKSTLWDGRATLNAAIFYNDVSKGHLMSFNPSSFAYEVATLDYASYGGEIEARAMVSPEWTAFGNLGYTHATIGNVPAGHPSGASSGNTVPNVPKFTANIGADYRVGARRLGLPSGELHASASYQYVGERAADVSNTFDLKPYGLVNARIGWEGSRAGVYLFSYNLLDERYEAVGGSYGPGADFVRPGMGRTIGLGATVRF